MVFGVLFVTALVLFPIFIVALTAVVLWLQERQNNAP